jgi:hypothetical protein
MYPMQIKCCPSTVLIFQRVLQKIFNKPAIDIIFDVITDEADHIGFLNVETKYILCRPIEAWIDHFAHKIALLSMMPTRKTLGLPEPDGGHPVALSYFLDHDKANFTPGLKQFQNLVVRMAHLGLGPDPSRQPGENNDGKNSLPAQNQDQQQPTFPAPSSIQFGPNETSRSFCRLGRNAPRPPIDFAAKEAELDDLRKVIRENIRALRNVSYNIARWKFITLADPLERQPGREDAHVGAGGRREDVKPRKMKRDSDNAPLVESKEPELEVGPELELEAPARMRRRDRMRTLFGDVGRRVRKVTRDVVKAAGKREMTHVHIHMI